MFPVPAELNLDRLIGQQLQQICIGAYDLQFWFEGENRIRTTGRVTVAVECRESEVVGNDGWQEIAPLAKIAGREVTGWRVESTYCFSVSLTGDVILRFWSEDSPYEDIIIDPEVLVF